jgi:hypothetical protein
MWSRNLATVISDQNPSFRLRRQVFEARATGADHRATGRLPIASQASHPTKSPRRNFTAISVSGGEPHVLEYLQARMPYGLVVPM